MYLVFPQLGSVNGGKSRSCHKIENSMATSMSIILLVLITLLTDRGMMIGYIQEHSSGS